MTSLLPVVSNSDLVSVYLVLCKTRQYWFSIAGKIIVKTI